MGDSEIGGEPAIMQLGLRDLSLGMVVRNWLCYRTLGGNPGVRVPPMPLLVGCGGGRGSETRALSSAKL